MANERRTSRSRTYRDDRNRDRGYKMSRDSKHKRDKSERKAPPEFTGKPCHVHGDKARHTYEDCRDYPKNHKSSGSNRDDNNKSAVTTRITKTNATSVARTSPQKKIVRRSRAMMREC